MFKNTILTPNVWSMREKYEKLDFIKIKNFYSVRTMSREEKSGRFPKTER